MSAYGLTPRQRELLAYIAAREVCPSYEEMRAAMGLSSKSGVHRLIEQLERRGYVRKLFGCARSVEVIPQREQWPVKSDPGRRVPHPTDNEVVHLPLYGRLD